MLFRSKTFSPGDNHDSAAGVLSADWMTDKYNASAGYSDIQQAFNAEMGFIPRRDIRKRSAGAGWTPRPHWRGVRQLSLSAAADSFENHAGLKLSSTNDASFTLTRNDRSNVKVALASDFDHPTNPFKVGPATITPGDYDWRTLSASATSDDSRRVYGGGGIDVGGYYGGDKQTIKAVAAKTTAKKPATKKAKPAEEK